MIPETPPDTSSRFPITASYADTASFLLGSIESASYAQYAASASYLLGFIASASYAQFASTASYLLGSVQSAISASWAALSGHANTADSASYAVTASYARNASTASISVSASYALTASYLLGASPTASYALTAGSASYALNSSTSSYSLRTVTASYVMPGPVVVSGSADAVGYINSIRVDGIDTATIIDSFPTSMGNSAKWLLSIGDGASFKTSELISIWNPGNNSTNFAEVTTNALGTVPVVMSVNLSAGDVRLIANPASGSWTIKMMRFLL